MKFASTMKVRGFSAEMIKSYTVKCREFLSSCGVAYVNKLTEKEFMEYLKNMVDEGLLRVTFPLILCYWASYETGKEKSYLIKVTSYQFTTGNFETDERIIIILTR